MPLTPYVLLDFDGTLVNSEALYWKAERDVFRKHHLPFDDTEHANNYGGLSLEEFATALTTRFGRGINWEEELRCHYADVLAHELRAHDGVDDFLLAHSDRIALVSNSRRSDLKQKIEWAGLHPRLLDGCVTRDDVKHGKPAPDVYLLALSRLHLSAEDAIAIEDSVVGIASASAAGIQTFGVASGMEGIEILAQTGAESFANWTDLSSRLNLELRGR
jgi:HAD superfamily hydrolase (TIGR01509 family)